MFMECEIKTVIQLKFKRSTTIICHSLAKSFLWQINSCFSQNPIKFSIIDMMLLLINLNRTVLNLESYYKYIYFRIVLELLVLLFNEHNYKIITWFRFSSLFIHFRGNTWKVCCLYILGLLENTPSKKAWC